jgi:hypothetical protein
LKVTRLGGLVGSGVLAIVVDAAAGAEVAAVGVPLPLFPLPLPFPFPADRAVVGVLNIAGDD